MACACSLLVTPPDAGFGALFLTHRTDLLVIPWRRFTGARLCHSWAQLAGRLRCAGGGQRVSRHCASMPLNMDAPWDRKVDSGGDDHDRQLQILPLCIPPTADVRTPGTAVLPYKAGVPALIFGRTRQDGRRSLPDIGRCAASSCVDRRVVDLCKAAKAHGASQGDCLAWTRPAPLHLCVRFPAPP